MQQVNHLPVLEVLESLDEEIGKALADATETSQKGQTGETKPASD